MTEKKELILLCIIVAIVLALLLPRLHGGLVDVTMTEPDPDWTPPPNIMGLLRIHDGQFEKVTDDEWVCADAEVRRILNLPEKKLRSKTMTTWEIAEACKINFENFRKMNPHLPIAADPMWIIAMQQLDRVINELNKEQKNEKD